MRAIFFDAAGTLIYLPQSVGEHYGEVAVRFGLKLPAAAWQQAFFRAWQAAPPRAATPGPRPDDDKSWWRDLVEEVLVSTLPPADRSTFPRDAYFEAVYAHFAAPGVWALFPEAAAVLADLHARRYRLGVISNFDRRLETILSGLGVRALFDRVIVSSQAGAEKPDSQIFRAALDAFQVTPAEAVHVGDDPVRDGGAEAIGLRVFHLDRPRVTLADLPAWLERLPDPAQEDLPRPSGEAK